MLLRQLTHAPHGHILTNHAVWSPDSQWLVYDTRSDPAGNQFDGTRIERVHVETGQIQVLYESRNGANCGVALYHPTQEQVVFIHGPEHPTSDWSYTAYHRRGVIVATDRPGVATTLDACDIVPPFTPGALRGGTHVHQWSPPGDWLSFTYEDHHLATLDRSTQQAELNQRLIGVSVPDRPVNVPASHPRNHAGSHFSVIVTRTWDQPEPETDQISRACEDAWLGTRRALAFQGTVVQRNGATHAEVFIVELPDDLTNAGDGPLCGTATTRPRPPHGVRQRRLTWTDDRPSPGLAGPRHWLRSNHDGSLIGCYMLDEQRRAQLWIVEAATGALTQVTQHERSITSCFSWEPGGSRVAYGLGSALCITNVTTGQSQLIELEQGDAGPLLPEACVWSPDGRRIAFVRPVQQNGATWNQIFVAEIA